MYGQQDHDTINTLKKLKKCRRKNKKSGEVKNEGIC